MEAHANAVGPRHVSAALAWADSQAEPGLFYEVGDETDADDVEARVRTGIEAGMALRDWSFHSPTVRTVSTDADLGTYASAVVLAAYGQSTPIPGVEWE